MVDDKKTDFAKKEATTPTAVLPLTPDLGKKITKDVAPTVSAPLIPLKSDSIISDIPKDVKDIASSDAKKDEPRKDEKKEDKKDNKKDDKKSPTVASTVQVGPTLEDLAKQQLPTVEEAQKKNKDSTSKNVSKDPLTSKESEKKSDITATNSLEEIAAQDQLTRQKARSGEYRVPGVPGPQSTYQSNPLSADPNSMYRPGNASAPYTANRHDEQQELVQRGGVMKHYERADPQSHGGNSFSAVEEERRRIMHGDKGLLDKYNRR